MILVGRYRSPFTRRVAITMRLLGLSYEHRPMTAWENLADVQTLNPVGRVPALILDDGEVLFDSAAILDHLDQLAGSARALVPASGPERRTVQRLVALALGVIEKDVAIVYERNMRPEEKQHTPWIERCAGQVSSGLAALDGIDPSPWLMGETITQADVTTGVMVDFIRLTNPDLLPARRYPNLGTLAAHCADLTAFAETTPEA